MITRRRQFLSLLGAIGGMVAIGGSSIFRKLSIAPGSESANAKGHTLILKHKNPSGRPVEFQWAESKKIENLFNSYVAQGRILGFQENIGPDSAEFIMTFKSKKDLKNYFTYLCRHSNRNHRRMLGIDRSVKII